MNASGYASSIPSAKADSRGIENYPLTNEATRRPQVLEQMQLLHQLADDLSSSLIALEVKMEGVLMPAKPLPTEPPKNGVPPQVMAPLAESLAEVTRKFRACADHIHVMKARIEV